MSPINGRLNETSDSFVMHDPHRSRYSYRATAGDTDTDTGRAAATDTFRARWPTIWLVHRMLK